MTLEELKIYWLQTEGLTLANLKSRYRGTWTGFIWTILNPLIMFGAQSFAFNYILKIQIHNYSLFLLSGLLPWLFLNQTIEMGMGTLQASGRLLKSFPIHPFVLICAVVIENFFNFFVAFVVTILPSMFLLEIPILYILLAPLAFFSLFIGTITLTSLAAIANVFYRDLRFILRFILSISFFFTPIFYDISIVPVKLKWIVSFNVFYYMIVPFRQLLHEQNLWSFATAIVEVFFIDIGLIGLTFYYWKRKRNELYSRL